MAKVHLAANKGTNGQSIYARCAAKSLGNGMSRKNSRKTYAFMASDIVDFATFKRIDANERCAHCVDMGLSVRNMQRKAKGLPPVSSLFETDKPCEFCASGVYSGIPGGACENCMGTGVIHGN